MKKPFAAQERRRGGHLMGDAAQDVADAKEAGENVKNQSRWCGGGFMLWILSMIEI